MQQYFAFKWALQNVILSSSPCVRFSVPYMLRPQTHELRTRNLLPPTIHWSKRITSMPPPRDATDCLDFENHQQLDVLFTCWVDGVQQPCIEPQVVNIFYYGKNDLPLGHFIETTCLDPAYVCPNPDCDVPIERHFRSFTHNTGKIIVGTERLREPISLDNKDNVLMWSWCENCENVTQLSSMDTTTWQSSLGKFLELSFYARDYVTKGASCEHSYHRHHVKYFSKGTLTVYFDYQPITLMEVAFAPRITSIPKLGSRLSTWLKRIEQLDDITLKSIADIKNKIHEIEIAIHETVNQNRSLNRVSSTVLEKISDIKIMFKEDVERLKKGLERFKEFQQSAPRQPALSNSINDLLQPGLRLPLRPRVTSDILAQPDEIYSYTTTN
eukprot:gene5346-8865_t